MIKADLEFPIEFVIDPNNNPYQCIQYTLECQNKFTKIVIKICNIYTKLSLKSGDVIF